MKGIMYFKKTKPEKNIINKMGYYNFYFVKFQRDLRLKEETS